MERRRRIGRTGLLIFITLLLLLPAPFSNAGLWADEGDAPRRLEIRVEMSSANPVVNSPWSIFILINHPSLSEVTVKPPRLPPSLILERVRTETRLIRRENASVSESPQTERWARVEFLFTPHQAGVFTLEPFEVTVPGRQETTGRVTVSIREQAQAARRYDPRFRWPEQAPSLHPGGKAELVLELTNWNPGIAAPSGIFQGRVPLNAIIEESLPKETGSGIYRYTITVIALNEGSINLGPVSFTSDLYTLSIPGIKILVLPSQSAGAVSPQNSLTQNSADNNQAVPFPEKRERVFSLFRTEYDRIISDIRILWNGGRHALALVEMRRAERDSYTGPFLAPLRREMEQALGLGFTRDEAWRPLKISLVSWVMLGILIVSSIAFLVIFRSVLKNRKKNPETRRRSGLMPVIAVILSAGLAFIFLEEGLTNFPIRRPSSPIHTAVLRSSAAFRVPDHKGAVNTRFDEGQPVTVGDYRGEWCYAESPDGRSGWVPWDAVIIY
jgi:hypothetical protein